MPQKSLAFGDVSFLFFSAVLVILLGFVLKSELMNLGASSAIDSSAGAFVSMSILIYAILFAIWGGIYFGSTRARIKQFTATRMNSAEKIFTLLLQAGLWLPLLLLACVLISKLI